MLPFLLLICFVDTSSQSEALKPISMAALGRQFTLGVLYDRRREKILEGPKLWNSEELGRYEQSANYGTFFQVIAASDIKDNMNHFGLSASLKMSFLSGTIDVQGSASYLQDRKTHNRQARVSLGYKSDTFKRTLHPELFTSITYPEVLIQEPDATDVVTAIQYGAGAIFTFDRLVREDEKVREIQGRIHISVTKLPAFKINGTGFINMTEKERKEVEQFSCKFHGDFNLKTHPGTYEEAIKVYKELPSLLGKDFENSVPVKVWLYPIEKLPVKKSAQLVHDISDSIVSSVTDVISQLEATKRECSDILSSTVARRHGRIRRKITDFYQYVERYQLQFEQQVAAILPQVRKGTSSLEALVKLVATKEASPFGSRRLDDWLSYYKEEVEALSKIQSLPNYCRNDGDFSSKLLKNIRFTVGLTLQLGKMDEPYLDELKEYLKRKDIRSVPHVSGKKWFSPGSEVLADLYVMSTTVRDFDERLKGDKGDLTLSSSDIQFLVREKIIEDEGEKQGIRMEFYDRAVLTDANYPLTSPPGRPKQVAKTYDSVTLEWSKPTKGNSKLKNYKVNVYVRRQKGETKGCTSEFCKITSISTTATTKKITGLKAHTSYFFTISTFTDLGETSVSPMTNEIVTDKCSPGTYHVTKYECKECSQGTYADKIGMTSCDMCPSGTYNSLTRAASSEQCINCPAGTYSTKDGATSKSTCVLCSIGTYSSHVGASAPDTCKKCAKGSYGDQVGLPLCNPCPENTYNPDEGQSVCHKCPPQTQTRASGAVTSSECIGKDAIAVAMRRVNDVKTELVKQNNAMMSVVLSNDGRLTDAIKKLPGQEKELQKDIDTKVKVVVKEMEMVHKCAWTPGEGSWRREDEHTVLPNVQTRGECIYKCIQLRKNNPSKHINGVSRKLSTRTCICIENMVVVRSTRYEYCKLI